MGHSTDICLLELWAVLLSLRMIGRAPQSLLTDIERVVCIIDNRLVVQWLSGNWQMLNPYTRDVLLDVYKEMLRLHQTAHVRLFVQWCRRGIWPGNERADEQAKAAVTMRTVHVPRTYLSAGHNAVKTHVKHRQHELRLQRYEEQRSLGSHLLSRNFFQWDLVRSKLLRVKDDFKMLSRHQLGIITALRSGHSRCLFSRHVLMHHSHYKQQWPMCNGDVQRLQLLDCRDECCATLNNGRCTHCQVLETEEHFLLVCPAHARLRRLTFGGYRRIYLNHGETFDLRSLLFPPKCLSWRHRKAILQNVVIFAVRTGRFNRFHC